jgi:hypothetical protein
MNGMSRAAELAGLRFQSAWAAPLEESGSPCEDASIDPSAATNGDNGDCGTWSRFAIWHGQPWTNAGQNIDRPVRRWGNGANQRSITKELAFINLSEYGGPPGRTGVCAGGRSFHGGLGFEMINRNTGVQVRRAD